MALPLPTQQTKLNIHTKKWRFKSASNSATGGSKRLKQDPSPASFMLRTAGFEKLAVYSVGLLNRRLCLKYYQVRKTKSSVPRKWFTRWLAVVRQPNRERSLLIPSLKKPQPTKQNIRGWSRKTWPIKVGNREKIPRGIFFKLLNTNAFSIICTKIKMYKPLHCF